MYVNALFDKVCTSEARCHCAHGFTGAECGSRISRTGLPTVSTTSSGSRIPLLAVTDSDNATFNSSTLETENEQQVSVGKYARVAFKTLICRILL
jgi:hypothetical protein